MPKIFEKNGFVIYVYPDEQNERHHLLHIHVYRGRYGGHAMAVQIPELILLESSMTTSKENKAMGIVAENLSETMQRAADLKKIKED